MDERLYMLGGLALALLALLAYTFSAIGRYQRALRRAREDKIESERAAQASYLGSAADDATDIFAVRRPSQSRPSIVVQVPVDGGAHVPDLNAEITLPPLEAEAPSEPKKRKNRLRDGDLPVVRRKASGEARSTVPVPLAPQDLAELMPPAEDLILEPVVPLGGPVIASPPPTEVGASEGEGIEAPRAAEGFEAQAEVAPGVPERPGTGPSTVPEEVAPTGHVDAEAGSEAEGALSYLPAGEGDQTLTAEEAARAAEPYSLAEDLERLMAAAEEEQPILPAEDHEPGPAGSVPAASAVEAAGVLFPMPSVGQVLSDARGLAAAGGAEEWRAAETDADIEAAESALGGLEEEVAPATPAFAEDTEHVGEPREAPESAYAPEPEYATGPGYAPEPEPEPGYSLEQASVPDVAYSIQPEFSPAGRDVSGVVEYALVAPVELHFSGHGNRVGVKAGTRAHAEFQRLASILLDDLRMTRGY